MKRICKKCGEEKEIEEFVKSKGCYHDRGWACKQCIIKYRREWRKTSLKYKASSKAYSQTEKAKRARAKYAKTPQSKASKEKYEQKNGEKKRNRVKQYRKNNIDKVLLRERKWRANNKKIIKMASKKYNKRIISALSDTYIRGQISKRGLARENITPQMIELKRELILFHRLLKEVSNGINGRGVQGITANT